MAVLYSYLADVSVYLLIVLFVVLTLVTATVDIVCDGFVVDLLPSSKSKWGGFGQVGGAYAGFALGGGGFYGLLLSRDGELLLPRWGWNIVCGGSDASFVGKPV